MKTLKQKIAVMQAAEDGKDIEILQGKDVWDKIDFQPDFNWEICDYRIKEEPVEFWVNVYDSGVGGNYKTKKIAVQCIPIGSVCLKTIKVREVTE